MRHPAAAAGAFIFHLVGLCLITCGGQSESTAERDATPTVASDAAVDRASDSLVSDRDATVSVDASEDVSDAGAVDASDGQTLCPDRSSFDGSTPCRGLDEEACRANPCCVPMMHTRVGCDEAEYRGCQYFGFVCAHLPACYCRVNEPALCYMSGSSCSAPEGSEEEFIGTDCSEIPDAGCSPG
jgi:hypothetical protein